MTTSLKVAATPNAFNRKAGAANPGFSPLAALTNGSQWIGDTGFNLMVVPNPAHGFLVMISPLFENQSFIAVPAPVPNRSGTHGTSQNSAIKYSQTVAEKTSKNILHEETGMWLNQTRGTLVEDPTGYGLQRVDAATAGDYLHANPILRSGTIPHGNTVHATGTWTRTEVSPPASGNVLPYVALDNFQHDGGALQFLPYFVDGSDPSALQAAYREQIRTALKVIDRPDLGVDEFINPIGFLNAQANNLEEVVSMAVSTKDGRGGVLNVPFERAFAGPQDFIATFMIETVRTAGYDGIHASAADEVPHFLQLQYLQSIPMRIPRGFDGKDVMFPHWNVNTLIAV